MENKTLDIILNRFDKLDDKFDRQAAEVSSMASRVSVIETKLEPVLSDVRFKSRMAILTHSITGAVAAGIVLAFRAIWPAHVPPPSILGK